jgi:nucleoside-diphosphate-sugar epimerase
MNPMNILVLGGTRFFGKTLVEQLGSAGHAVTVLSRGKLPPPAGAAHLVADRADPAALTAALAGRSFDVVIDNVAMTAAHVGAALDALGDRTGHYVLTSTAAVYGDFAHGRIWREPDFGLDRADLDRTLPHGEPYTIGKRAAEAVLWRGERSRVPFTIVRPGYVVGPHDHLKRMEFFLRRLHDGGPVLVPSGSGDIFQLAWHADVASAMARVLGDEACFGRAYNLCGPELFTYPTLVRALAAVAGTLTSCVEIPRENLRSGALAAEELPFGEDGSTWACDTTRLEHELGITPTPAATWMGELVGGAMPERDAEDEARRAAELALTRWPGAIHGMRRE